MTPDATQLAVLDPLLAEVPLAGWSERALRRALAATGQAEDDAPLLFPNGPAEMVEVFAWNADRRMEEDAAAAELGPRRVPARVRAIIALRLAAQRPHKAAIRRALALLALPGNAAAASRVTARTVDAIWHAAGDTAADFSWYTKRAILAGIYAATLLYWLRDDDADDAATLAFLDRRLAGVARLGKLRARLARPFKRLRSPNGPLPSRNE